MQSLLLGNRHGNRLSITPLWLARCPRIGRALVLCRAIGLIDLISVNGQVLARRCAWVAPYVRIATLP